VKIYSKLDEVNNIKYGFFSRNGGTSTGIYSSLNCGYGSGDNRNNILKNRAIIAKKLGIKPDKLFTLYQCHTNKVVIIDNIRNFDSAIKADALVTEKHGVAIGILTADCAPVLFSSKNGKIIGAAHAGWKGAIGGILENTVAEMYNLGANHEDIIAVIGPCISGESYEVGEEFRDNFLHDDTDNHRFFKMLPVVGKFMFDLPSYITFRLESLGLASVQWVGQDTLKNEEDFFSYRRSCITEELDYGRQISAIVVD
jgi:YfiH family protein